MNKGALLRLVCSETGIDSFHMGRIDLHSRHAFFEVDNKVSGKVLSGLKTGTYEGNAFEISSSQEKEDGDWKEKKKHR